MLQKQQKHEKTIKNLETGTWAFRLCASCLSQPPSLTTVGVLQIVRISVQSHEVGQETRIAINLYLRA